MPSQDEVEEYWQSFERLTRKYWAISTAWQEYDPESETKGAPPFPGWEALGM